MKISDIMTRNPYTLSPHQTIAESAALFFKHHIDGAPVVNNGKLVGFFSKHQLFKAVADCTPFDVTIDKLMIKDVITCHPNDDVKTLLNKPVSRCPVVQNGTVVGVVTQSDVVRYLNIELTDLQEAKLLKEQMEAIFEASFDYLFVTDAEGRVTKVSPSYYRITGIKPEEVLGKTMYELVAQGFYDRSCSIEVLETLKPVTFVQKIKTGRTVLVTGNPVFDDKGNLIGVVTNGRDITELNELKRAVEHKEELSQHYKTEYFNLKGYCDYVVASPVMVELMQTVNQIAQFDSAVMITGESGVGKEIIAHQIHLESPRKDKPYIRINCASIPESLLESELFGYVEGAFTGAKKGGKLGIFELANGGTLLLDEISELPLSVQAKLLRVIQENEVTRIGSTKTNKIDVRIITATNRDLSEMVNKNLFRTDLYYRLNVIPVVVPPLRERREEIPVLVDHFLKKFNEKYGLNKQIAPQVIDRLMNYDWPGNVRELKNVVERAVVTNPGDIILSLDIDNNKTVTDPSAQPVVNLRELVENLEKHYINTYLAKYGSTRKAAAALGISQSTLCRKVANYGIHLA
ncbi:MAG TPA: sigma 54-interacting transcriptional regulator [Syntrophomonadaceae bacterium]|nr:sigma 54-interacting transcriptional regulator [Syntrophomonadaceae bacterium]HQA07670.1 sigma 54-interacting transcriptional regulator [Syntrophomonadaceae bacterium]HQE22933.1 sigma 54-interacting transcriptional regulator [Syntrophomonadaceae bacterium]